jgi:hypothetical protein
MVMKRWLIVRLSEYFLRSIASTHSLLKAACFEDLATMLSISTSCASLGISASMRSLPVQLWKCCGGPGPG